MIRGDLLVGFSATGEEGGGGESSQQRAKKKEGTDEPTWSQTPDDNPVMWLRFQANHYFFRNK